MCGFVIVYLSHSCFSVSRDSLSVRVDVCRVTGERKIKKKDTVLLSKCSRNPFVRDESLLHCFENKRKKIISEKKCLSEDFPFFFIFYEDSKWRLLKGSRLFFV